MKTDDFDSTIYVCTYGYEITNCNLSVYNRSIRCQQQDYRNLDSFIEERMEKNSEEDMQNGE